MTSPLEAPTITPVEAASAVPEAALPVAEAMFAEHVESVARRGDTLDALSHLSLTTTALRVAPLVAAITEVGSTGGSDTPPFGALITAIAVAYGAYKYTRYSSPRSNGRLTQQAAAAEAIGQNYELYRSARRSPATGKRELSLIWHGPNTQAEDPEDIRGNLRYMAELAKQNGITRLVVRSELMGTHFADQRTPGTSRTRWFLANKALLTKNDVKDRFDERTPDEWLRANLTPRPEEANIDSLEHVLSTLEETDPTHPLLTVEKIANDTDRRVWRQKMLSLSRQVLVRRAGGTEALPGWNRLTPPPTRSKKADAIVMLDNNGTCNVFADGEHVEATSIEQRLGVSDERTARLLKEPKRHPEELVAALEVSIFRHLTRKDTEIVPVTTVEDEHLTPPEAPEPVTYQQQLTGKRKATNEHGRISARRHILVLIAGTAAMTAACNIGVNSMDAGMQTFHDRVAVQIQGRSRAALPLETLNAKVDAAEPVLRAWDDMRDVATDIDNDSLDDNAANALYNSGESGNLSLPTNWSSLGVGGVQSGTPNNVDWKLTPVGTSPKGYWAVTSSDTLVTKKDAYVYWAPESSYTYSSEQPILPTQINTASTHHYIAVQKDITSADAQYFTNKQGKITNYFVPVPVLDGALIVAAQFTAKPDTPPVALTQLWQQDGTSALQLPVHMRPTGSLTFWIVPNTEGYGVINAESSIKIAGTMPYNEQAVQQSLIKIDPSITEKNQPNEVRAGILARDLHEKLIYSLDPLPKGLAGDGSVAAVVQEVVTNDQAICNVAATVEAVANPKTVNIVGGFLDDGTAGDEHALLDDSKHLYTVDRSGDIDDATPAAGIPYSSKLPPGPDIPRDTAYVLLPLALGTAILRRRRIAAIAANLTKRQSVQPKQHKALLARPAKDLTNALELAQMAAYAASPHPQKALARAKNSTQPANQLASQLITRRDLHSKATQKRLRSLTTAIVDTEVLRTAETSHQILKEAYKAATPRLRRLQLAVNDLLKRATTARTSSSAA